MKRRGELIAKWGRGWGGWNGEERGLRWDKRSVLVASSGD